MAKEIDFQKFVDLFPSMEKQTYTLSGAQTPSQIPGARMHASRSVHTQASRGRRGDHASVFAPFIVGSPLACKRHLWLPSQRVYSMATL